MFVFYPYFFSFLLVFFSFYQYLQWQWLTTHKIGWGGNNYFSCFTFPPANEHSFSWSRFLPLIFIWSICNYQTDSWWHLFSLDICLFFGNLIDVIKSELLILTIQSDILTIWLNIKPSLFYYQANVSSTFTPLSKAIYLPYLPNLTPTQNLSSNCPKNV